MVNNTVEVEFHIDSSALTGTTCIVFEELACNGQLYAEREDIGDEGQTLYIP